MLANLALLIMLPLVELLTAFFAKKYRITHKIILFFIISSSIALSLDLPISDKIYSIDFGFIKLKFMCDIYSYFFGVLVTVVWFLTILYTYSYRKLSLTRSKVNIFFKYLSLTIFAVLGNGYAADLWTLFIFYNLLILFTAPLIIQHLSKSSLKALKSYLYTHFFAALLIFLPAIILLQYFNGNVDFIENKTSYLLENARFSGFLLFLFVMGISKNCIFPFHNWIVKTTVAPTPVSGLLHSVAAVKSGSIAMIKIAVYIFGLDYLKSLTDDFLTGGWVFYLCGFTAVYAAYKAYKTHEIKSRFAYSTISQLSYIMTSIMLGTPLAVMGAVLHIISHSLSKLILFFITGIFNILYKTNDTIDAAKIAPHMRFWIFCLAFAGASIIGIPLMPGSFGKDYMLISEWQTHHYSAIIFLILGSFINILYIYPIIKSGFFGKKSMEITTQNIPLTMKMAIILGVLLSILMSFFINDLINFLKIHHL